MAFLYFGGIIIWVSDANFRLALLLQLDTLSKMNKVADIQIRVLEMLLIERVAVRHAAPIAMELDEF